MTRLCAAFALSFVATPTLTAADKLPPELALIPTDAAAFVTVRYDLLNRTVLGKAPVFNDFTRQAEIVKEFENKLLGFPPTEIERATAVYPTVPGNPADQPPVFIVTRTKPIDRGALIRKLEAWPFPPDRDEARRPMTRPARRGVVWESRRDLLFCFAGERTMVLTTRRNAPMLMDMLAQLVDPPAEAPLGPALAAAAEKNVLVAGATGAAFRQLVGLWPVRDKEFKALARASAVTLVANLEPDFRLTVRAAFPDQRTAGEGQAALAGIAGWATDALKELSASSEKADVELSKMLLTALRDAGEPARDGKAVTLTVRMKADEFGKTTTAFVQSAVVRIRTAAERMKSFNNLKQMGLAVHNLHDTYGQFAFQDRPQDYLHPGLSWRVGLLPFIEQDQLYKQFHLDEPWDSKHNKQFIEKMPKVFAPPPGVEAKLGHTFYRMFDGPGTMYRIKTLTEVTDGTSNTLMVVEAGEPVIWTKPDELEYDLKKPLPKLGGHFPDGFCALMGDGSVKFIRKGTDEKVIRALITADGGETVTPDGK